MTTLVRFSRFSVVGMLGIGVQLIVVTILALLAGVDPVLATAAGVSAAVAHNFAWHARWTWRDRLDEGLSIPRAFARFVASNGAVSILGSIALVPLLEGYAGLPIVAANLASIVMCGVLNFWIGDRVTFPDNPPEL